MPRTSTVAEGRRWLRAEWSPGCSSLILLGTALYLGAGLAAFVAYRVSGDSSWIEAFFHIPGALMMVCLACMQLGFSIVVCRQFGAGEPLRIAWQLIAGAAALELASTLAIQIFAVDSSLNPLHRASWWSQSAAQRIREAGLIAGGPLRFVLLAAGLYGALRVYRRSGFLGNLRVTDRVLLALIGIYVLWEAIDLGIALGRGKHPGWAEIAGWPVDPLLWVLLLEAILLYRSVQRMGASWIGRCWISFAVGIALVSLGDIVIWASAYGYLPWPWTALEWYVWLPAAAAFALAPAYQLEAIQHAGSPTPPRV